MGGFGFFFGGKRSAEEVVLHMEVLEGSSFGRLSISLKVDDRSVQGHLPKQNAWRALSKACCEWCHVSLQSHISGSHLDWSCNFARQKQL